MATDRNKIIVLLIALAISSNAVADNAEHCVSIVDSKERLECTTKHCRKKICRQKSGKFTRPKSIDTNSIQSEGIAKGHGKTNLCASRCPRGLPPS